MSHSVSITIQAGNRTFPYAANPDASILTNLIQAGILLDAPCNGNGTCGKCRVTLSPAPEPSSADVRLLPQELLEDGLRLACSHKPVEGLTVLVGGKGSADMQVEKGVQVQAQVAAGSRERYGMAVDIGTTTVAAYFYNLQNGTQICVKSSTNLQRSMGADVISRIAYCNDTPGGLETISHLIRGQLQGYIDQFCAEYQVPADQIDAVSIAANTTMLHLLCKVDPRGIANAPFTPASLFGDTYRVSAADLDLRINPAARVYLCKCVAGYVGGDITAGALATSLPSIQKPTLFIDIGTNGEMMLVHNGKLLSCATAAGPAFEGAHISCGTGSVEGAISSVQWEGDKLCIRTIGDKPAVGICGSGLIDAIAAMLERNVIDETGYIESEEDFVLDAASGVAITQQDVREIQLAKAAIAAGIETMLHCAGVGYSDLDAILLAGGFGSKINPASACRIGLLPMGQLSKIKVVGNAAGAGAVMALLDPSQMERIDRIAGECEYIELSENSFFNAAYIDQMAFEA